LHAASLSGKASQDTLCHLSFIFELVFVAIGSLVVVPIDLLLLNDAEFLASASLAIFGEDRLDGRSRVTRAIARLARIARYLHAINLEFGHFYLRSLDLA